MFVKICGITTVPDARMVAAAGANAIGLNFYGASPRLVSIETAQQIAQCLPSYVDVVGLFVNATPGEIRAAAAAVGIRTVQLHGQVTPELIRALSEFAVIPAFPLSDADNVSTILQFVADCQKRGRLPSALLVDGASPGQFGGTGQLAAWPLVRAVVERCPVPVALAGGLTPKNVADAIRAVRPWGVDVASGVEVAPGRKESFKVREFIRAAMATARE